MSTVDSTLSRLRVVTERSKEQFAQIAQDNWTKAAIAIIVAFCFLGLFGPTLAPHDPIEDTVENEDGRMMRLAEPNDAAPMGTTTYGKDVLSQFLVGARPTFLVGLFGGLGTGVVGFLVGLVSGYYGGRVDEVLMRLTDLTFSLPFTPMAIFILTFITPSVGIMIAIMVIFLWKIPARIVRSEVLTVKERTFVKGARAGGAGHLRTMLVHVAPNVLPVGFLYAAYAVSWSIGSQAAFAFLGFGDPTTTSWGRMLRMVFASGSMREAWWWVLPPAIGIAAITTAVFLVGRAFEEVINPELQEGAE